MNKYIGPSKVSWRVFLIGLVFIVLLGCEGKPPTAEAGSVMDGAAFEKAESDLLISQIRRKPTPNLEFTTFDGKRFNVRDYLGHPVVMNFWASWCGPCRLEAKIFEHAYKRYSTSAGVVFVGMAVSDRERAARNFVKEFSISYPNGIDETGEVARRFNVFAVPQTFILDKKGRVALIYIGAIVEDEIFDEVLGRLIKE